MVEDLVLRDVGCDDIEELAALVADAFVGYRAFAPADWQPPSAGEQSRVLQHWIADSQFWGELASDQRALIGHATFVPAARHSFRAAPDPTLAHLGHLFVRPRYWGSGVATQLLAHAMTAAGARGFATMRLFVPAGQARARRFYAREGFVAVGEPFDFGLGLPVFEYRRLLER
jgi:GNAT superfamily N-acetyltransferase